MELDEGVEEIVYRFNVDMTDEERELLLRHAKHNMPETEYEEMLLNWSFINLIELAIEDDKKKNAEIE